MENKDWIKNLKVGDKVFVREYSWAYSSWSKAKVEKITPKGFIRVKGVLYKPEDGFSRGEGSRICDYNDETNKKQFRKFQEENFTKRIISEFRTISYRDITYVQAMEIAKIMGWEYMIKEK